MTAAGNALIPSRANLTDQVPNAVVLIKARLLQGIGHQRQLRPCAIGQRLGGQHEITLARLLIAALRAAAHRCAQRSHGGGVSLLGGEIVELADPHLCHERCDQRQMLLLG